MESSIAAEHAIEAIRFCDETRTCSKTAARSLMASFTAVGPGYCGIFLRLPLPELVGLFDHFVGAH
jgi:hypothetical protein